MDSGRKIDEITLVAVTKTVDEDRIINAIQSGISDIGENRVQEIQRKYPNIKEKVRWHLIGTLQSNKVRQIIDKVDLIHSLDRLSLAEELEKRAAAVNRKISALIQVNIAKEEPKSGLYEDEVMPFIEKMENYPHIAIKGLMTIAPLTKDNEEVRPFFKRARALYDQIANRGFENVEMCHLSMGMSNDFEVALQEGANMIRIGRAIFGERTYP